MPRYKKTPFEKWETKSADGIEKRYFRMGATLMASEPLRTLSPSAFKVLCFMKIESAGKRSFTYSNVKYRSFMSKPTFFKAIKEVFLHVCSENAFFYRIGGNSLFVAIANIFFSKYVH